MTTEELIGQLTAPIFVYRMASGLAHHSGAQGKAARDRMDKALAEIDRKVRAYYEETHG